MRIAIIGAAGMVGSQIVAEAAARGHQVHGYTRSGHGTDRSPRRRCSSPTPTPWRR